MNPNATGFLLILEIIMKQKKKFDAEALDAKRPRYDPDTEGYGSTKDWRRAFGERMGLEEALEVMAGRGPRAILEVSENAGPADIQKAYRKLARQYHPDRILETGYTEQFARAKFQEIQAAYVILGGK